MRGPRAETDRYPTRGRCACPSGPSWLAGPEVIRQRRVEVGGSLKRPGMEPGDPGAGWIQGQKPGAGDIAVRDDDFVTSLGLGDRLFELPLQVPDVDLDRHGWDSDPKVFLVL